MATKKELSMKLLIDNKTKRVLFAEAEKEVIDFLFSLLALPVGSIIDLVTKESMVGSMGNLYASVEDINESYVLPNRNKNLLLKPNIASSVGDIPLLPCSRRAIGAEHYYRCTYNYAHSYITKHRGTKCPTCLQTMEGLVSYIEPSNDASPNVSGYVKGLVTYMVSDDLEIKPISTISSITLLKKFNGDVSSLEEKVVGFGLHEGLEVLKAALHSKTVLTDAFLGKKSRSRAQRF